MWVEMRTLKVGDLVQVRGRVVQLTLVHVENGHVAVTGDTETGEVLAYVGDPDELLKKAKEMALHDVGVLA